MFRRLVWLLILSAPFLPTAFPQDPPHRDPQAVQLLTQSFLAMGGAQKAAITDVRVEGTLAMPNNPARVVGTFIAKARGNDFSVETTINGEMSFYRVLKGRGSVKRRGETKVLRPYNTEDLSLDILPALGSWTEFLDPTTVVESAKQSYLDASPVISIRVRREPASTERDSQTNEHRDSEVLLDPVSGLVVAIRYKSTQGSYFTDKVTVENRFTDYQMHASLLLPGTVLRYRNGRPLIVLRITSVRFHNGFTDSDFEN